MKAFIRVVEAGSFTRASEQLGLPKSTVTRLVQSLESSMETKLLNRTSRRLNMTEQGSIFYQGSLKVLEQLSMLESSIRTELAGPRGKIRVEMPHALGCHYVIPRLPEFTEKFPGVQIEAGISNHTSDLIEDNYDCVIRIGNLFQDSLIARALGTLKMVTFASPSYLGQRGKPEHPEQLSQKHSLVQISSPRSGQPFKHKVYRAGHEVQLRGEWVITVNDAVAAFSAAKAGLGIATTYRFLTEELLKRGELIELFSEWQHQEVPVHIAWPENRHLPVRTRVFIDWIRTIWEF
jgi:DNA-binding transcriptional LysR family regulator